MVETKLTTTKGSMATSVPRGADASTVDHFKKVTYLGPAHLHDDFKTALSTLSARLTTIATVYAAHTVLKVQGFGPPDTLRATAVYLVGAIAQCIQADLSIRAALFNDATRSVDLEADIAKVVGDAKSDDDFKTMTRNPWMWEGISHMIVHLSGEVAAFHPSGKVLAKTLIKHDVNDHGLDLVAIYDCGQLGLTAGESKAYLDDPARAVGDASTKLAEIDESLRDMELRATVTQLRPSLPPNQQQLLGGAFWRENRTYYPFVCYDQTKAVDWARKRPLLENLQVTAARKLLVPFSLQNARQTFDSIASYMLSYASGDLTTMA